MGGGSEGKSKGRPCLLHSASGTFAYLWDLEAERGGFGSQAVVWVQVVRRRVLFGEVGPSFKSASTVGGGVGSVGPGRKTACVGIGGIGPVVAVGALLERVGRGWLGGGGSAGAGPKRNGGHRERRGMEAGDMFGR